jgi:hypothetical protein
MRLATLNNDKDARSGSVPVADAMENASAEFLKQASQHSSDLSVWTKLYAANHTMLSAMREQKVGPALVEICSNLLACEELAIIEIERPTKKIHFMATEGLPPELREALIQNARLLESWTKPGNAEIAFDETANSSGLRSLGISALIPLWADEQSSGAIVLFQLLPQRTGFDAEDREVLQLLAIYAGPCLRSQRRG